MLVIIDGIKKDLHYTIASKLLKSGQAQLIEEKQNIEKPKQEKKIVKDGKHYR